MGSIFLAVILYFTAHDAILEKKAHASLEACLDAGNARVMELLLDPKVNDVVFGTCLEVKDGKA